MASQIGTLDVNVPVRVDYFAMKGGFDQMSPTLTVPPGRALYAQNFEVSNTGGYRRIEGYERYDGRPSPHDQSQYTIPATITGAWAAGNTLTGASSGATAIILGTTSDGFVVCKIVGTFLSAENLQIAAVTVAVATAVAHLGGASTPAEDATFKASTADYYRADIGAVPGSGSILGVWVYSDYVYAFRNNAGGTACVMHKSSTSGWTEVALGYQLPYNDGTGLISAGDTVSGVTSGATGVVTRVVNRTGTWGTDAQGMLVFSSVTDTFVSGEHLSTNGGGTKQALANGTNSAITLPAGGRYQFVNYNFGGASGTLRMYGCNGVGKAFEFDGTVFAPITTGMAADTPSFITAHKSHLFLSFGASVQHSSIGNPYAWTAVLGAGELAVGDVVTGLTPHVGNDQSSALIIMSRNRILALYGSSSADWSLVPNESEVGGLAYTQQKIGDMYWLDDRGVTSLKAVFQYGNFQQSTITQQIYDWITRERPLAVDSCIVREKNQYRLFFSNGDALYVTYMQDGTTEVMPVSFIDEVTCSCSTEWPTGNERIFFGSDNGYVYEMEAGTSMDGQAIQAYFITTYNHLKSPQIQKRYRKAAIDVTGDGYLDFYFGYDLGYGDDEIAQPDLTQIQSTRSAGLWDAFTWDRFFWDTRTYGPVQISVTGSAENIALAIRSNTAIAQTFTITGMMVHYTPRRRIR